MRRSGALAAYARALGVDVLADGTITCPWPGHSKDDRSLSVHFTGDETFAVHSFAGDDWQLCKDHVRSLLGWRTFEPGVETRLAAAEANRERTSRHLDRGQYAAGARRLWHEAHEPRGTLVEEYLGARGIALPGHVCGRVLRFHPHCRFGPSDDHHYAPAMIARFTPIVGDDDSQVTAIHRTELLGGASHGVKKMLGSVA